jgi:hypothetical protein
MKLKLVIPAGLLIIFMLGCKSKVAFNYSQTIVKIEKSLEPDVVNASEKITGYLEDGDFDSVALVSAGMEKLVESKLKEVQQLEAPPVEEGENFKRASIRYFSYMRDTYTAYRKFGEQTTEEAREEERKKLLRFVNDARNAVEQMQAAQRKFAAANNFRIEDK